MRFATQVPVLRVTVNAGNSLGSAGFTTNLAPSMTLGTGYVGRSSVGENLEPRHLVNWTRVAYNADAGVPFGNFAGISPWERPASRGARLPAASNRSPASRQPAVGPGSAAGGGESRRRRRADSVADAVREQLRALIIEELEHLMRA